jgi:phosphoribosylanthranilate isomerase
MKIKVCGITSVEQLRQLESLGVDYAGLIFFEGSKRYIGDKLYNNNESVRNTGIKKVGVFVNTELEIIEEAIKEYGLYAVQLHGDETDEFCLELMDKAKVIKVFRIGGDETIDALVEPFQAACHYFLFDTDTSTFGGSGKQFNWALLEDATVGKPFFLSGGIGPDDVEKLEAFQHPYLYAVDVNSRFETEAGVKDMELVKQFVSELGVKNAIKKQ